MASSGKGGVGVGGGGKRAIVLWEGRQVNEKPLILSRSKTVKSKVRESLSLSLSWNLLEDNTDSFHRSIVALRHFPMLFPISKFYPFQKKRLHFPFKMASFSVPIILLACKRRTLNIEEKLSLNGP